MSLLSDAIEAAEANAGKVSVPYSQIPAVPPEDLWPGVVPLRQVTMLAAPGKTGKGLVIAAAAGIVTSGAPWPGDPPGLRREPGSVIIVAPEDDPNEDMAWRLRAAGANLSLVRDLTVLPDGSPFFLPDRKDELRQAVAEAAENGPPARLIALDPVLAMASGTLSSARGARAFTGPLQDIARETGAAVMLTNHTTKDDQTIAGSKSLTDACRVVWLLSRVTADQNDRRRAMVLWASNRMMREHVPVLITGNGTDVRAVFAEGDAPPGSRASKLRLVPSKPVGGKNSPLSRWQEGRK